ncbi:MAG: hypothetical protein LBI20_02845, partial [Holosporales bacterium]|nr:hypothetical protein [Holosporales bacterium]
MVNQKKYICTLTLAFGISQSSDATLNRNSQFYLGFNLSGNFDKIRVDVHRDDLLQQTGKSMKAALEKLNRTVGNLGQAKKSALDQARRLDAALRGIFERLARDKRFVRAFRVGGGQTLSWAALPYVPLRGPDPGPAGGGGGGAGGGGGGGGGGPIRGDATRIGKAIQILTGADTGLGQNPAFRAQIREGGTLPEGTFTGAILQL